MTTLTRRYRFSASHRLHSDALTAAENDRAYGKCNNPFGHGHDYLLEVTAGGPVDPVSGRVLRIEILDRLVEETILSRFSNRNLNVDIPEFATLVPTTENIALMIARLLEQNWTRYPGRASVHLCRIHIQETDRNSFEILLPAKTSHAAPQPEIENVHA